MDPKRLVYGTSAAALVAGGLLVGGVAFGQGSPPTDITPEQARAAALAAVPGTALEVEREREGGRLAYEVEVRRQNDGRVVEVLVDASSGEVFATASDDDDGPSGEIEEPSDDD